MRDKPHTTVIKKTTLDEGFSAVKAYNEGGPKLMLVEAVKSSGNLEDAKVRTGKMAAGLNRDIVTANLSRGRLRARAINRELTILRNESAVAILGDD